MNSLFAVCNDKQFRGIDGDIYVPPSKAPIVFGMRGKVAFTDMFRAQARLPVIERVKQTQEPPKYRWSKKFEQQALETYSKHIGRAVLHNRRLHFRPEVPWLRAIPDGLISEDECVEVKSSCDDPEEGRCTSEWFLQIQLQMFAAGAKRCHLLQYGPMGPQQPKKMRCEVLDIDFDYLRQALHHIQCYRLKVHKARVRQSNTVTI